MTDYGLTSAGWVRPTVAEMKDLIDSLMRQNISPSINTSSASLMGNVSGIGATMNIAAWEAVEKIFSSFSVSNATGIAVDYICEITGTTRREASKSTVTATVNVDPGTYAIGDLIASVADDPAARFSNIEEVVNAGSVAVDIDVAFECEITGPVRANSGTLTVIAQSVSGWNEVNNAEDASLGADVEQDSITMARREDELAGGGFGTVAAIRTAILQQVTGVLSCKVLENVTSSIDANGLDPYSFEAIVRGPDVYTDADDEEVAAVINEYRGAGCATSGTTEVIIRDSNDEERIIKFTRPTFTDIYLECDLVVDDDKYAGDLAVQTALTAYGDANLGPGSTVYALQLKCAILSVDGVLDVTELRLGTTASPVGTVNIDVDPREIAELDSSRIVVNS